MIIKILPSDRAVSSIIKYNSKDESELIGLENTTACTVEGLEGHLQLINEMNSIVGNKVFHVAFSMAEEESNMPEEEIRAVIGDYMRLMGYETQPYGVFKHSDREHIHYHVVSSRIDSVTGKKIKDNNENYRSLKILKELIQTYRLGHNLGDTPQLGGLVNDICGIVTPILKKRPHSFLDFQKQCLVAGITANKTQRGVVFFMNDESLGRQHAIRASELPIFSTRSLTKILTSNRYYRGLAITELCALIDNSIEQQQTLSVSEYRRVLGRSGVRVEYAVNSGGIYGIKYAYKGFELTGSDLGSQYSWNQFREHIVPDVVTSREVRTLQGASESLLISRRKGRLYIGGASDNTNKKRDDDEQEQQEYQGEKL